MCWKTGPSASGTGAELLASDELRLAYLGSVPTTMNHLFP
jgi:hypothetical protein